MTKEKSAENLNVCQESPKFHRTLMLLATKKRFRKATFQKLGIASCLTGLVLITSCSKLAPEEKPEEKKPTISAPKKISSDSAAEVPDASSEDRSERSGREDSDYFSEEEKAQQSADREKRREVWLNMSEKERESAREEGHRRMMAEVDKNGDGILGKDELPERIWEFMKDADKDGDDQITEAERIEFVEKQIELRAGMEAERAISELTGEERVGSRAGMEAERAIRELSGEE